MVKSIEVVDLKELKEVHAKQFESDAKMLPENHIVFHMNHIHNVIRIVLLQKVQDLQLDSCLILVLLLVLYYLDCNFLFLLMIKTSKGLKQLILTYLTVPNEPLPMKDKTSYL